MSIKSITLQEARDLVQEYHKEWIALCNKIRDAASRGETSLKVKHINNFEIRSNLDDAGFDVDIFPDPKGGHFSRIWWGS